MTKYLFIYWTSGEPMPQPSPEQMQQMLLQWQGWKEKFKDEVLDTGDGLQRTGRLLKNGEAMDGPYAEAKEIVGGFSIVQAASYESALAVARECPITHMPGAIIEIREMMGY